MYQESDSCAINTQKKHFLLAKTRIALLLVVAAVATVEWDEISAFKTPAAIAIGVFLVILLVLTAIGDAKGFDKIWFNSRAVAESVKKETWLFIMKSRPYDELITETEAENLFLGRLEQIRQSQPVICSILTQYSEGKSQVTPHMKSIRKRNVADRLAYYLSDRVLDQRQWYTNKAKSNHTQETRWFISAWVLQLLAVVLAFVIIFFNGLVINPVGILTTAGAGVLSWVNARNYGELSLSYGLIAQRLSILQEQRKDAMTEENLATGVSDFEQAISTEHTIWLARRLETV
jgi:hypothetical protein